MSTIRLLTSVLLIAWAAVSAAPAWAQQANAPARRVIPNQYIVVLAPQPAAAVVNVATAVAETHNALVTHVYRYALQGMAVEMTPAGAAAMAADPRVEMVVPDEEAFLHQIPDDYASPQAVQAGATWGLDRIDQRDLPLNTTYVYNFTAPGVHAYIIDSGINPTHTEFTGRVGNGVTFINDGNGVTDCRGHGTHVSGTVGGTVYGVAKQVTLHPVRVFGCTGGSPFSTIIAGVDWVTANHVKPAVANMSLGGGGYAPLDTAVVNSINAGVTYVVSAGNDDADACTQSPARVPQAITVGASTITDSRDTTYSNWGTCVDIFAPGTSITSAWYTSNTATGTISGTSMASPHVAGVAALYLSQNGNQAPATVAAAIINNASVNKLINIGAGSPNRLLYSLWGSLSSVIEQLWPVNGAQPGGTVPLWAYVRNNGTVPLPADARVWFYVNGPSFAQWVGSASVAGLAPGAAAWYSYSWTIPAGATPGAWQYRAQVWTNATNISPMAGPQAFNVTIQPAANITSLWPVNGAQPGATVPLWAYVTNTGAIPLPADARVWFHVEGVSFGAWVGSTSTAGLAPGASAWYSYSWTIPAGAQPGAWRYRAQVWTNTAAISTLFGPQNFTMAAANQVSARVNNLWPVSGAQPGATVPLWAHVTNTGNVVLPADARVWFLVQGPSFAAWVGSASTAGLAPGASAWYSFNWTIPANVQLGTYGYQAEVWTNTGSISNRLGPQVFSITGLPTSVLSLWPVSGAARGATVPLWAYVRNETGAALAADARVWYAVQGPSYSAWVGFVSVAGLAPGAAQWYAFNWTIPGSLALGNYGYSAQVWNNSTNLSTLVGPQAFSLLAFGTSQKGLSPLDVPDADQFTFREMMSAAQQGAQQNAAPQK